MFCANCGKSIPDGSKFCPECGSAQTSSVTPRSSDQILCPVCGSPSIHFVTTQGGQEFKKGDACCGYLICGPLGLLCGVKDKQPAKTIRKCMKCGFEF